MEALAFALRLDGEDGFRASPIIPCLERPNQLIYPATLFVSALS